MDFLNKAYRQISELFASMTPAARLTTGLLVAVIAISLGFLFRQQTDRADEYLFGARAFTNSEIADMTTAFSNEGLDQWEVEGNKIRVPRGKRYHYYAALVKGSALPEDSGSSWEDVLEKHSPLENRKMQELRARVALEKSLAFTIREFPGIESASVKITEIPTGDFVQRNKRRAAVSVRSAGSRSLDAGQVKMIRDFVAFGGGVEPADVVIADTNGRHSYTGPPADDSITYEQNAYADTQRRYEETFRSKIAEHLSMYPGAKVSVYVELDEKLEDTTRAITYDEKPTPIKVRSVSTDTKSISSPNEGRPGAEPNGVGNRSVAVSTSAASENTKNESVEETENVSGIKESILRTPGLIPKMVTVSIYIPKSHFKKVWEREHPAAPGDDPKEPDPAELQTIESREIANIEKAVFPLIPKAPPGEDTFPRIRVVPYIDVPLPEPTAPGVTEIATSWFAGNWQTVAMFGLALFGLFFLRNMIRSARPDAVDAATTDEPEIHRMADVGVDHEDADEDEVDELGNSLRGRFSGSGRSLRDELTELVREDPDAAASVLQNWITEAA